MDLGRGRLNLEHVSTSPLPKPLSPFGATSAGRAAFRSSLLNEVFYES